MALVEGRFRGKMQVTCQPLAQAKGKPRKAGARAGVPGPVSFSAAHWQAEKLRDRYVVNRHGGPRINHLDDG